MTGNVESQADRDLYAVELEAGVAYTINLAGGTLSNALLRLVSSAGAVLAENDDIAPGNPDSRLSYVPTVSGTYYIEAGASGSGLTGTYKLSLSSPTSQTDDFANGLADATHPVGLLTVGGSGHGTLEVPTDRDWFRVKLTEGEVYVVSLTGTPEDGEGRLEDSYLWLHDAAGNVVAENDDLVGGDTLDSQLVFEATQTGLLCRGGLLPGQVFGHLHRRGGDGRHPGPTRSRSRRAGQSTTSSPGCMRATVIGRRMQRAKPIGWTGFTAEWDSPRSPNPSPCKRRSRACTHFWPIPT